MSYPNAEDQASSKKYFQDAVKYINGLPKEQPIKGVDIVSTEGKLGYYALYKIATQGKVPDSMKRPGMFDLPGQFKYDAWKALENLTPDEAETMYTDLVAMSIIVDSKERPEVYEWLNNCLAKDDCPAFLKVVLEGDRASWPRMWKLAEEFANSIQTARDNGKDKELEALRWQSIYGDVYVPQPGMLTSRLGGFKLNGDEWKAWSALKGTKKDAAMQSYIDKSKA